MKTIEMANILHAVTVCHSWIILFYLPATLSSHKC